MGEKSRAYILKYFVEVAKKSQQIEMLKFEDFIEIIKDDMLNCREEETVWELCLKWIDFEPEQRSKSDCVYKLLQGVRLGLLETKVGMR